jgi:YidC/Oxa1 family membrane protein insertase
MKKMQKLQPLMDELREKYKDDPQKMNQSIMNLYKEYGVNPAGGCLPLLLQMPIMYALYSVFRGAIELRQANFVGWITDLSIPDVIYRLPFKLPLVGIQDISGIAVLMGVTMFFQTKMTTKDPRQKAMV